MQRSSESIAELGGSAGQGPGRTRQPGKVPGGDDPLG